MPLRHSPRLPLEKKPNIIHILVDDMGYADVGFNGCKDIRTPNLDQLASQSAVLESIYAQPVCSPGRAALMTGRCRRRNARPPMRCARVSTR